MDEHEAVFPNACRSSSGDGALVAVRGAAVTEALRMLLHQGRGYWAKESVEHTLWDQIECFDAQAKETEEGEVYSVSLDFIQSQFNRVGTF